MASEASEDEPIVYVCTCGWRGTEPVFDAHLAAFCPRCGRPAEFEAVARILAGDE